VMDSWLQTAISQFGYSNALLPGYVFSMLMHAKKGNLDEVERLFQGIARNGLQPNSRAYAALLVGYATVGDLAACQNVILDMEKKNVKPEVRTFEAARRAFDKNGDKRSLAQWTQFMSSKLVRDSNTGQERRDRPRPRRLQQAY